MHRYRSHTCGALRDANIDQTVRLSGWCHRIRDHGGLLFIDLRDHYGMTQVVADPDSPAFKTAEKLRSEWVIRVDGKVRPRPAGTENTDLPTVLIEVFATDITETENERARNEAERAATTKEQAEVVDPATRGDCCQVFFAATVTVCNEAGDESTYAIVGVDEADVSRGHISWVSPLARALMKLSEGDVARLRTPAGYVELEVVSVCYVSLE